MSSVTFEDSSLLTDSIAHDDSNSNSDNDDNSDNLSDNSDNSGIVPINPLVPFQENSAELAMAQKEEDVLRQLANDRMQGLVDPIVKEAIGIADVMEKEKLNDHGKPWKEPPPVEFGTEYWKAWRERIKVDKKEAETPEEEAARHRKAEMLRRKNRPGLRDPLPKKKGRYGSSYSRAADFSQKRYNTTWKNDPRIKPPKTIKSNALKTVEKMMRESGLRHPDEVKVANANSDANSGAKAAPPKPMQGASSSSISFSTSTRNDWSKVTSLNLKPLKSNKNVVDGGNYDIANAEKNVLKRGHSVTMLGRPNEKHNEKARSTPGAIYDVNLDTLSTKRTSQPSSFGRSDRFKKSLKNVVECGEFGAEIGPQTYKIKRDLVCKEAMAFDGLKEFENKEAETPKLRAMRNFGFGCNLQEHILYGQCLNGKCSTRSPWEKFNSNTIDHWRKKDKKVKVRGEEKKDAQRTALHFATLYADLDLVGKLCLEGADVDAKDERSQTPLHIAAEKGLTKVVERLLNNANFSQVLKIGYVSKRINPLIDEKDEDGNTPLHLASHKAHRKCVELLIDAGANPDILNNKGMTALDVAGSQALFATLEFYCEISKERARYDATRMKERGEVRKVNKRIREASRQELSRSQAMKSAITREMDGMSKRATTMIKLEQELVEGSV